MSVRRRTTTKSGSRAVCRPSYKRAPTFSSQGRPWARHTTSSVRGGRARPYARALVRSAVASLNVAAPTIGTHLTALDLAADHKLQIQDALIIRTATEAECNLLLSEDMQDGFTVGRPTITDPFAPTLHPALAALLDG